MTLLGLIFSLMTSAQSIKIMTYNIRFDNPADSVNAWPNRMDKVSALIHRHNPDIIGVQEALKHQLNDLVRMLPEYSYFGVGRDDGKEQGEYSAILYDHNRFSLLDSGTFWLSETPEIPGSKNWDAAITRVASWSHFLDKNSQAEFFVLNTHFDHIGKMARTRSAELIKAKLPDLAQGKPILITGDFNCTAEEEPYLVMTNNQEPVLQDASRGKHKGTFCGFEVGAIKCIHIDYIFYSKGWRLRYQRVFNTNNGTYYPSDHLPVLAKLKLITEE
jgi:endonuclease/exonuclease/phosphatase family metal-dependent hydrolase